MKVSATAMLLGFLVIGAAEVAAAQAEDARVRAERLFREGVGAAREERWVAARRSFSQAYESLPRPAILLNLAVAQAQTDQLLEARQSYLRFLEQPEGSASFRDEAQRALGELEAELPRARFVIEGSRDSDQVFVDDRELGRGEIADGIALNPGSHIATVRRRGQDVGSAQFVAERRQSQTVRIEVSAPEPVAVAEAEAPALAPSAPDPMPHVIGAGALLAVGVGLLMIDVVTLGMNGSCSDEGEGGCIEHYAIDEGPFAAYGAIGLASLIGGAVWLGIGLTLGPPSSESAVVLRVAPGGLAIGGRF